MAIAFDANSSSGDTTGTSLTWAHTCTGTNRILWTMIGIPVADSITGVTYNSVSMTQVGKIASLALGRYIYLYYLAGPSTGSNNIVASSSGSEILRGNAASYTGASQTGIPDAVSTNSGTVLSGAALTGTVTVGASGCWLVMAGYQAGGPLTAGASTTLRAQSGTSNFVGLFDSNGTVGTGSQSLNETNGDGVPRDMELIIASFGPPVTATRHFIGLLGVGA